MPIAFSAGCYGTYLEWALTCLVTDQEPVAPFTDSGSSHLFLGNHVGNITVWRRYTQGSRYHQFVRYHPKVSKDESLVDNLEETLKSVDNMILIYPDQNSQLLVINNWISKACEDWLNEEVIPNVGADQIYKNWPVAPGTPIESVPVWILRELLSYYLMPAWQDQVEWYLPDHWQNSRCHVILVNDLITRFEHCLEVIRQQCNLTYLKPIHSLRNFHEQMLALQRYRNQDYLCNSIVSNTLNNVYFDWQDQEVPLGSQAWVQWQLRNLGWEIQCNGLDIWPTNSVQLRNLIYQSNNDKSIP